MQLNHQDAGAPEPPSRSRASGLAADPGPLEVAPRQVLSDARLFPRLSCTCWKHFFGFSDTSRRLDDYMSGPTMCRRHGHDAASVFPAPGMLSWRAGPRQDYSSGLSSAGERVEKQALRSAQSRGPTALRRHMQTPLHGRGSRLHHAELGHAPAQGAGSNEKGLQ